MASYDEARNIRQALYGTLPRRILHPRVLSEMASYDEAKNIRPALYAGDVQSRYADISQGRAVQFEPKKPTLTAPVSKRLKL